MKKQLLFSWMHKNLEIKHKISCGKGVFATSAIQKDEKLSIFGGYVVPIREITDDLGLQIDEDFVLSSGPGIHSCDYFNHSCSPNAGIKGQIILAAMRDIDAGEEICFDYAMCLHAATNVPRYEMDCHCGEKNCRGLITEDDWQSVELQVRYSGFFSWFIQEKINAQQF